VDVDMKLKVIIFFTIVLGIFSCSKSPTNDGKNNEKVSSSSTSSSTSQNNIVTNPFGNGKWVNAIVYSGYRNGQYPGGSISSESEILQDLQILTNKWKYIRNPIRINFMTNKARWSLIENRRRFKSSPVFLILIGVNL
jgi:hypothetical protein